MHSGERDFYFNRGADAQLSVEDIEQINVKEFAIVHFGSATAFLQGPLQQSYFNLMHKCVAEGVFISFDPNYRHLLFKDNIPTFIQLSNLFLQKCQFFKVSDEEAVLLTNTNTLDDAVDKLLQNTTAVFAITLGKLGTLLGMNGKTTIIPSIPISPVDTTGAGDAFVGAVLYQLAQSRKPAEKTWEEWQSIVAQANKAGARTCEYMGAMEAFKHLSSDIFK
jgi:fructokinase